MIKTYRTLTVIVAVIAFMVAAAVASAAPVYATVTGYAEGTADNNHPETWGEDCTKIEEGSNLESFVLPELEAGLVYDLVIVKAGSDVSTDGHANTLFDNPSAGETVWADSNGNGIFDFGGPDGDKTISHIIICTAEAEATPTPVPPTPGETPGETPAATPVATPPSGGTTPPAAGPPPPDVPDTAVPAPMSALPWLTLGLLAVGGLIGFNVVEARRRRG